MASMDQLPRAQSNAQSAEILSQELLVRYGLSVQPAWIDDFLSTVRNPPPPLPALASTAHFRLINGDLRQSLGQFATTRQGQESTVFPHDITDVNRKQTKLCYNIPVQILDVLDVGSSKWSQIEAIERVERGEEVRGREVIRSVPILDDENGSANAPAGNLARQSGPKKSAGPHKLLLQDAAGTKVWGFELGSVPRVFLTTTTEDGGLQIGTKVMLKAGTMVRRGMVMLEPETVTVMGGKIEEWDKRWRANRKQRLANDLRTENEQLDTGD